MEWLISEGAYNSTSQKKHLLTSYRYGSADQNTFCIIWFSIKLQNIQLEWLISWGKGGMGLKMNAFLL